MFRKVLQLLRYRFFLTSGLLPYLLGSAIGYHVMRSFNLSNFILGILGIFMLLGTVESFNEYFDPADRVFMLDNEKNKPSLKWLLFGIVSLVIASSIALYFTLIIGYIVLLISLLGVVLAVFYVGPPLRLAFRGLGELAIFLAYGPFMTLGAFVLQTYSISFTPIIPSIITGIVIVSLDLANEIPDYYQDKLSGKNTITVRIGVNNSRKLILYLVLLSFIFLVLGVILFSMPEFSLLYLALLPIIIKSVPKRNYEETMQYIPLIKTLAVTYILVNVIFIVSYVL
ncbi:prenyltransferase [Acidianus ambivalens]|uniref:Prenyltransferase n=1 Tax=Acidianus ambivalens TaxID=2283 RepID=A0A650CVS3_ACIAM|nr:prenyltransferase [Acidianus ambivalens]MQL56529.1 hypothetical protein [Acidianus ambivalens]QGR21946.1 hypothetical protein D1866_07960 [Acidianus ambivalens]